MWTTGLEEEWSRLTDEILAGVKAWRTDHPRATLDEIEAEVDARMGAARGRLLEAAALAGPGADPSGDEARQRCPGCGAAMQWDRTRSRQVTTTHNQDVTLTRRYARCPRCGTGLSPLDETLGLLPGQLTPWLVAGLVRLGTSAPFAEAAGILAHFTGTTVSEATARRVTEAAGAAWVQGFLDLHAAAAVRILDFPHAVGDLAQAAQAAFGPGTAATSEWLATQARELKRGDPDRVLAALGALPPGPARTDAGRYLTDRRAQITYDRFIADGFPIGSGCIESANKHLVQRRLKGAGMHWGRAHVNPMLGLRTVAANDRWAMAWPQIAAHLRDQTRRTRTTRRAMRPGPITSPTVPARPLPPPPAPASRPAPPTPRPKLVVNGRPTPDHPWKRRFMPRRDPSPALPPKL